MLCMYIYIYSPNKIEIESLSSPKGQPTIEFTKRSVHHLSYRKRGVPHFVDGNPKIMM